MTRSGALAAFVTGTCVFAAGGWPYAAVLFAFFLPSTLLTRVGRARKAQLVDSGKQGARDAAQVFANGGIAALCALVSAVAHWPAFAAAFAGAFAAASADTWGTEIGTLSRRRPRSILTLQPIAAGLSGGVTLLGTSAEIAGALAVAIVAAVAAGIPFAAVLLGGICGALADSVLGACVQALRYCPQCKRTCETDPHACGTPTQLVRGTHRIGNDAVNGLATLTGALLALAASRFFPGTG